MKMDGDEGQSHPILNGGNMDSQQESLDYRRRLLHTVVLYWGFIAMGWVYGQRGAAFLDLLLVTDMDVARGSLLFTLAAVASMMAALVGGIVIDKVGRPLLQMACGMFLNGLLLPLIPLCTQFYLMAALFFVTSLGLLMFDIATNSVMARLWKGKQGHTFMQGLHFCFAFGAILSPLATEPFLASRSQDTSLPLFLPSIENRTCDDGCLQTTGPHPQDDLEVWNVTLFAYTNGTNDSLRADTSETQIFYAFLQSSVFCMSSVVLSLLLLLFPVTAVATAKSRTRSHAPIERDMTATRFLPLVARVLVAMFYMFGVTVGFGEFFMTFVVRELSWDKASGARLLSVFWMGFAAMRLCGVVVVRVFSPSTIIFTCSAVVMASLIGLLAAVLHHVDWAVWTTACTVGLSSALVFPTGIIYAGERIGPLTGRLMSIFFISALVTTILNSQLIPQLMQRYDNKWYLYIIILQEGVGIASFVSLHIVTMRLKKANPSLQDCEININKPCDKDTSKNGAASLAKLPEESCLLSK